MDYDQLKTFLVVTELNSFTKAAAFLHITQSTVTSRIAKLEEFYGVRLFDRNNRDLRLSSKGLELLPFMQQQLNLYEKTKQIATQHTHSQELKIAVTQSTWNSFPVRRVLSLHEKIPNLHVQITTDHSPAIIQHVLDGRIDYGIVFNLPRAKAIRAWHLGRHHYALYRHTEVDIGADFDLTKLQDERYIKVSWGIPFQKWLEKHGIQHQKSPVEVSHGNLAKQIIIEQKGMGFLPQESVVNEPSLVEVSLGVEWAYQDYYAICLKNHPQTMVYQTMNQFLNEGKVKGGIENMEH
ncbi:hypothetical protein DH09_15830 [Bacillaceae bacterium JMAK1]|nr:hypothetical protein DH09_15830 [Bacillaceae bacterium JMAK1]